MVAAIGVVVLGAAVLSEPGGRRRGVVEPVPVPEVECAICARGLMSGRQVEQRSAPPWATGGGEDGAAPATDVLNYDLDVEINPTAVTIAGRNIMTVKSLEAGLTTFQIQLDQAFTISALTVDGVPAGWVRVVGPVIDVTLPRAYALDEQFALRVDYSGTPPTGNGFGSITFTTQNGQPLVHTLSEPYFANTWWPVKEDNNDKATGSMAFTVPGPLVVASNGLLQGVDSLPGGKLKYRWRTNYQTAPYLFSFSTTNYNQFGDTYVHSGGSMPLQFFIYPANDTSGNRTAWLRTKDMLAAFASRFGPYPFISEKYGIYQFSFGGGMEHQTMTGQGTFSESVTAHELGHQWWGDMITCATWSDIWLNEGFASYCEALWFEASGRNLNPVTPGFTALRTAMLARRPSSTDGTVYFFRTEPTPGDVVAQSNDVNRMFSSNFSYRKAGWVLHMLRWVVGDQAFFDILAAYRQTYQYRTAATADFQAVCEAVSGRDLDWFFNQWVFNPGAPLYSYGWRNVSAGGRNYVELYLNQTQNAAWPTFDMPLDVGTTAGTGNASRTVRNNARTQHLLWEVPGAISSLTLDPNNWVLTASNTSPAYGKTAATFVEGPPKIVDVQPAPGSSSAASVVRVTFHRPVNSSAGQYALTRSGSPVAFTHAYNAGAQRADLTLTPPIMPGIYVLTVGVGVTGQTGGLALDGEAANPVSPASLPTGDGVPGGAATFRFSIPSCSAADVATEGGGLLSGPDGFVTGVDFDVFIQAFFSETRDPFGTLLADLTDAVGTGSPDGLLTGSDFDRFIVQFFTGCP